MLVSLIALSSLSRGSFPPQKFYESGSPSVGTIDADVEAVMKASDVRGASIAIVNGTHLVYAKGYAYGGPNVERIEPTTTFRQASLSKFVCALAAMQCIEEGLFDYKTKMQDILHIKTRNGKKPVDPRFDDITIRDLLQMDSGLSSGLPWDDIAIHNDDGVNLPVGMEDIEHYAAEHMLDFKPGEKSQAYYNNANYQFLGYCVAKVRQRPLLISAIQSSLLMPLHCSNIIDARELKSQQLSTEAIYHPNPPATGKSVMSNNEPTVQEGYGDENLGNAEGAGGLSAAAVDMARILACLNMDHPIIFKQATTYPAMLRNAWDCFKNPAFSHHDSSGNSDAFGFFGLDSCTAMDASKGLFAGDKGGYLSTSQNGLYFERGGFAYVVNWSGHTLGGESWYPVFQSVMKATRAQSWGNTDLFPTYGMPVLTREFTLLPYHPVEINIHQIGKFVRPPALGGLR
jgi:CubicO group peptidase (beta-lactamase class C family)